VRSIASSVCIILWTGPWFLYATPISLTHSWSWALLEMLPIVKLLKNFPAFYGTRRFITCSQEPSTDPCPKPHESNPYHPILSLDPHLGLLSVCFSLAVPPIWYMHSSYPPFVLHALPISSPLTWSFKLYLKKSQSYEAPYSAVPTPISPCLIWLPNQSV
jgi:hypothetical protein